jgi:hypothetical protein
MCIVADGGSLPPMTLYKSATGVVYESWCEGGPEGATYAANQSGWFDMPKFNQWFKQVFIPHIRTMPLEDIKVLLGDNLAAHLSPYVLKMCERYNIRFVFLPENSTHILQPLDVAVFAPMNRYWREILSSWKNNSSLLCVITSLPQPMPIGQRRRRNCLLAPPTPVLE